MDKITLFDNDKMYSAIPISPSETSGKNCIFYGNNWYALFRIAEVTISYLGDKIEISNEE